MAENYSEEPVKLPNGKLKKGVPRTPEALARKKRHQFGQPEANRSPDNGWGMRKFYKWVESEATLKDLQDYLTDETNPEVRKRFIRMFLSAADIKDFFQLTNQAHGYPTQEVKAIENLEVSVKLD